MDDRHLSVELLRSIHRGERSPGDLASVAMAHLFEKCAECRKSFEAWRDELKNNSSLDSPSPYDEAFNRVRSRLFGHDPSPGDDLSDLEWLAEGQDDDARGLLTALISCPPKERRELIRREPKRFSGPALAALLLDEARNSLPANPSDSIAWATIARTVLQHTKPTFFAVELYSRALAFQANGLRAQGELRAAANLMDVARYLLRSQGGGDVVTRAELDSFEGSLLRAQTRYEEARDLFSRAVMGYALEGRRVEAARNLVVLGDVLCELGDVDRAIDAATQALETSREEALPDLERRALQALIFFLHSAGAHDEARRLFDESAPLYENVDPALQLRRIWLGADLAKAEGRPDEAEAGYRMVQEGFLRMGRGHSSAIAALHLAILYAEQGRIADIKRIAEEIIPVFEAQDIHREAAAALMLFQDAVRAEQVTLRYLIELTRYLDRARFDPTLAFQRPA